MNLLDKIDPYLTSEDDVIRSFALHAVSNFPSTKPEWPVRLLNEILKDPKEAYDYTTALENMTLGHDAVPLLAEAMKNENTENKHLFMGLARALPLEVKLENRDVLEPFFSMDEWAFLTQLNEASKEKLERMLESVLTEMESLDHYNQHLLTKAKSIALKQAEAGWVDPEALRSVIERQKNEPYFNFEGMIAVYKIGLIKEESLIEEIAPLLLRDEDILLEELKDALVAFQSDRVVQAVEPNVTGFFPIFQLAVIGETYTPAAIAALKRLYITIDDIDLQPEIVRGLAEQLSAEGRPEIEDFMAYEMRGSAYDTEELAYGYYKVMGYDHPELENWKRHAQGNIERYRQMLSEPLDISTVGKPAQAPVVSKKIGRNEPCPCGSGKKYKKCHGK